MNYFNYQPNVPMGRVWGLFTKLGELSEEECLGKTAYNCDYAHTLEIVNAALSGTIPTSEEDLRTFDLLAYEIQCRTNDKISQAHQVDKCLFIVDSNETSEKEETRVGYGDISSRKLKTVEEAFESIENIDSFEANINQLLNIRKDYMTSEGIDLLSIIINSLKGIPEATSKLSELVKVNVNLRDLIMSLCEDGQENALLERLTATI